MAEVTGQRIVSFVESSSPGTLDYFATDNATNGNRKVSYSTLSEKILDKLNTKTYSLDGSNKTVLEALAELYQADDVLNTRIDNIITPAGQASLSEVVDIRMNFLGETFFSAGESVRETTAMLASDYKTPTTYGYNGWAGNVEDSDWSTMCINVANKKGATFILVFNTLTQISPLTSAPSGLLFGSNSYHPDTTSVDVASVFGSSKFAARLIVDYSSTISLSGYRYIVTITIPEDFQYNWLHVAYVGLFERVSSQYMFPDFLVHYKEEKKYTFTDENSDGNIVIS